MAQVTRDFDKLNEPPHIPPPSPTLLSKPLLLDSPAPPPHLLRWDATHESEEIERGGSRGIEHFSFSLFSFIYFVVFSYLMGRNQSVVKGHHPFFFLPLHFDSSPPLFQLLFKSLWCQGGAAAASIPSLHFSFLFSLSPISLPSWKLMKWASPSPFLSFSVLSSLGLGDHCQIAYTAGINCERSVVV